MHAADGRPLVVVGDTLLDIDVQGSVSRLCPDEPAPVVEGIGEMSRPGGAGLAALIAARSRSVVLITAIGADEAGDRLRALLAPHVMLVDLGADQTVVKTRVRVGGRTLLRMDQVTATGFPLRTPAIPLQEHLRGAAAVLVSDYGLGLTAHAVVRRDLGHVPTVWDPHPRGSRPVPGVTTVTPNVAEAQHFSRTPGADLGSTIRQGTELARRWKAHSVTVTRGAEGAVMCTVDGSPLVVPSGHRVVGDTCGAGDACAAGIALTLAAGADVPRAVRAGVRRAGDFLAQGGVAGLLSDSRDMAGVPEAQALVERVRADGGTVVMAGGCFDLLHAGHVSYLEAARGLGDCLVVAVNSDDSVRRLKGPSRPLVPAADRARVLRALRCVGAVEVFDESTPAAVLRRLKPDIFAKGSDYHEHMLPEAPVVREYGGEVVVLPTLEGRSSTRLVAAAQAAVVTAPEEEQECRTQPA